MDFYFFVLVCTVIIEREDHCSRARNIAHYFQLLLSLKNFTFICIFQYFHLFWYGVNPTMGTILRGVPFGVSGKLFLNGILPVGFGLSVDCIAAGWRFICCWWPLW